MRRVPWTVRIVTALWGVLLLASSLLWPQGLGYDETSHLDMAEAYAAQPLRFYGPGELEASRSTEALRETLQGIPPREPLATKSLVDRGERPTLTELGSLEVRRSATPNQMVQHPPLPYWIYAAALSVPGVDAAPWDVQIWLLRLLSIMLVLPVPLLCWAAARRLLGSEVSSSVVRDRLALAAAVVPLTLPNLVRNSASVNNDVLLLSSCSFLFYFLVRVLTGDLGKRTAAGVAAALAVALLTKGYALVLPPVVLVTYLLASRRSGPRAVLGPLAVAAGGGVVAGLWWLRNLLVYGAVQSHGWGEAYITGRFGVVGDADDGTVKDFILKYVTLFVDRTWGGVGLLSDVIIGQPLTFGWFALGLLGVVMAVSVSAVSRDGVPVTGARPWAVLLSIPSLLTFALAALGSFELWQRDGTGYPAAAQGRYLYHLVLPFALVALAGWARVLRSRALASLPVVLLAAGLLTDALAWRAVLEQWYGVNDSLASGIETMLAWSPVPVVPTVALVVVLPLFLGCLALVAVAREVRAVPGAGPREPRPDPTTV